MKKLHDYSGEFVNDLQFSHLSSDTLAKLLSLYCQLYMALDGFWYLSVQEIVNNEKALACDIKTWERVTKYEMGKITKQLNIQGNDVITLMKAMQIVPWLRQTQFEIDIEGPHQAVFTVTHCPTLEALEREGLGRESEICNLVDIHLFRSYASFINPDIAVSSLKLPPRKSKDEICCQWSFTLESCET